MATSNEDHDLRNVYNNLWVLVECPKVSKEQQKAKIPGLTEEPIRKWLQRRLNGLRKHLISPLRWV